MRVLVTGGAGFIGSHVVDHLLDAGHEVRVLDMLHPRAHRERPTYLSNGVEYRWGDLSDADAVRDAVADVDAISHQASMVGLGVDFADVEAFVRANDLGTAVLLQVLHESRFCGRFVLASSMVVYGEGRYRCATHGRVRPGPRTERAIAAGRFEPPCPTCGGPLSPEAVPEDAPLAPASVYAATKLHQEHLVQAFAASHEVTATRLRYHNVYGPRMPRDTPYAGVASIFRSAIERGEPPMVLEDGGQLRDFVHVHDVARANVLALEQRAFDGPLNIASGHPVSVLDVAHTLTGAASRGLEPLVVGGTRPGDVRHVFAATGAAAEHLDFRATVRPADGIASFATAPLRGAIAAMHAQ